MVLGKNVNVLYVLMVKLLDLDINNCDIEQLHYGHVLTFEEHVISLCKNGCHKELHCFCCCQWLFPKAKVLINHLSIGKQQQPARKRLKLENENICTNTKVSRNECSQAILKVP